MNWPHQNLPLKYFSTFDGIYNKKTKVWYPNSFPSKISFPSQACSHLIFQQMLYSNDTQLLFLLLFIYLNILLWKWSNSHKNCRKCHWTPMVSLLRFHNQHYISHHISIHLSTYPSIHFIFIHFKRNNITDYTLSLKLFCMLIRFFINVIKNKLFFNHNNWQFSD